MARIRTVKPEFWFNEKLSMLPPEVHLLAAALLNYADDKGFFNANPRLIKAGCVPLREDKTSIEDALNMLEAIGYIHRGTAPDGRRYGMIDKFLDNQRVNRPAPSKIADISITWDNTLNIKSGFTEDSLRTHGGLTDDSLTDSPDLVAELSNNSHKLNESTNVSDAYSPFTEDSLRTHGGLTEDSLTAQTIPKTDKYPHNTQGNTKKLSTGKNRDEFSDFPEKVAPKNTCKLNESSDVSDAYRPFTEDSLTTHGGLTDDSLTTHGGLTDDSLTEGKGKDLNTLVIIRPVDNFSLNENSQKPELSGAPVAAKAGQHDAADTENLRPRQKQTPPPPDDLDPNKKFAMTLDWEPSAGLDQRALIAGLPLGSIAPDVVGGFKVYWEARPSQRYTTQQWEAKLVSNFKKFRSLSNGKHQPSRYESDQPKPTSRQQQRAAVNAAIDSNDTSWAFDGKQPWDA